MTLLVCAPTGRELSALAPTVFPNPDVVPETRPVRAALKRDEAIFLACGVGPINAALALGYALGLTFEKNRVDAILCAGLAGAFDLEKTPLRSLWWVSEEIWPEYGLNDGIAVAARAFRFPQWKKADGEEIYDRLSLADPVAIAPRLHEAPWPSCKALTVAGVTAGVARRDSLWNKYGAQLENMEGFAAAYAGLRAEIPCVEIRAVSNKTGPRTRAEKDFDGALLSLGKILPALNLL